MTSRAANARQGSRKRCLTSPRSPKSGTNPRPVYPAGSTGNATPSEIINRQFANLSPGLSTPDGIAFDNAENIYVANNDNNSVTVYPAGSNGNAAPSATIAGSNTLLDIPTGVALDSGDKIYVSNEASTITVYPAGSNGNATPTDIVDSEAALTRSEQRFFSATYTYLAALARLDYAMGAHQK